MAVVVVVVARNKLLFVSTKFMFQLTAQSNFLSCKLFTVSTFSYCDLSSHEFTQKKKKTNADKIPDTKEKRMNGNRIQSRSEQIFSFFSFYFIYKQNLKIDVRLSTIRQVKFPVMNQKNNLMCMVHASFISLSQEVIRIFYFNFHLFFPFYVFFLVPNEKNYLNRLFLSKFRSNEKCLLFYNIQNTS